jgi:hypothetical protein
MPHQLLPRFTYRDLERIQRAIDCLDAAARALRVNRNSTVEAVVALLIEAQRPMIEMGTRISTRIERWAAKHGMAIEDEPADGAVE